MSIDLTNNIVFDSGSGGLEPSKKLDADGISHPGAADSTLSTEYEALISVALEADDTDSKAVAEAREALETGLLDTQQAALSAAGKILKLGI